MRVGIFDSGFGGLTIYRAIRERLPQHDYVYLGDNARTPYGHRSFETVYRFTAQAVRFLFARDCALVVVACNTASARALRTVQQTLLPSLAPDRRVLGIIRPSVEALGARAQLAHGRSLGHAGDRVLEQLRPRAGEAAARPAAGAGAVSACSSRWSRTASWTGRGSTTSCASTGPRPRRAAGAVDALLLACTHYPLLLERIREVVPGRVALLSQGAIVAPSLADYLCRHPEIEARLTRGGSTHFLTTDVSESFDRLAELFLGHAVASERVDLEA